MFEIDDGAFIQLPMKWIMDMKSEDVRKMAILQWRFDFFASRAIEQGNSVRKCFYESKEKLAILFGMSPSSRTKVGIFLKRMEKAGYISTTREKMDNYKERVYIVVNNPTLLKKYGLTV